ncbi:MAG: transcriptional regulator [Nitrosopumilus sp.]|nr:transcriptional regulator [Nitrosopumilus sp.]
MKIVGDILAYAEESGEEGIMASSLHTKANLSSLRLSKFANDLTGAGLIATKEIDRKNAFVITSKGREYLESYKRFISIAESYGLEL